MNCGGLVMTGANEGELWPLVRDFHYSRRSAGLIRHAFAWREPGGLFGETGEPVAGITYSQPVEAIARLKPDWVPVYGEPKHLYIFPLRQKWNTIARQQGWTAKPYPKPNAARLLDEQVPTCPSEARTLGAAPEQRRAA